MTTRGSVTDARVRRAADASAGRGWHVFPTRPGGKEPRCGLSWPDAATADLARLALARWRPGEGYGIAAKPSGLVIIDLDRRKPGYVLPAPWRDVPGIVDGSDVLAALAERAGQPWPLTYWVSTPTGGAHLYFRAIAGRPVGNSQGRIGPMIDVRGGGSSDGGYVVGGGTVIDERAYPDDPEAAEMVRGGKAYEIVHDQDPAPLPGWLADLLDPPQRPAEQRQATARAGSVHARMRGLVAHVLDGQPHDRNGRVYWAACRAAELVSAGLVERAAAEQALITAALASGLRGGEAEARRTIASGLGTAA